MYDPWDPPNPPPHPSIEALTSTREFITQYERQIRKFLTELRGTSIIVPDRTPKETQAKFCEIYGPLGKALQKDSVPCFLQLFEKYRERMVSGYIFTPQAFDVILTHSALRCAELVLEGKEPKLCGQLANPNYITCFGYFPLHQAAETFCTDMVELLLRYGALANLRTTGDRVIEGLLPLHVAIENTCQHKYLEDNLIDDPSYEKGNTKYIYKLIHLLCLPEMKIFLDTTRLLATHTNDVVDVLWDYIKHGKLVPAAVLLLAAQRHFRDLNGFDTIKKQIISSLIALQREWCGLGSGKNTKAKKQWKEKKVRFDNASMLLKIIFKAGEDLDAYIQAHSEASHQEVLGKVSAVLQNYDVGPSGKGICIDDFDCRPYDYGVPDSISHKHGDADLSMAAIGSLEVEGNNVVIKEPHRGQNLPYARDQFLPIWRSVLKARFITRVYPSYIPKKELPYILDDRNREQPNNRRSSQIRVGLLGLLERSFPKVASNRKLASTHQSRRLFSAASTALKMLKHA
ncbi:uncharacterized protein LOC124708468 [Lolium rigidum]|uniref:uncharacterized protein LOC124708468 n=1 Tax=Lolium rigidum TaxID=89674 RepID=UPI001F5E2A9A|nr:uncharacterized protein LOC124708468 [Lolium rigidum]